MGNTALTSFSDNVRRHRRGRFKVKQAPAPALELVEQAKVESDHGNAVLRVNGAGYDRMNGLYAEHPEGLINGSVRFVKIGDPYSQIYFAGGRYFLAGYGYNIRCCKNKEGKPMFRCGAVDEFLFYSTVQATNSDGKAVNIDDWRPLVCQEWSVIKEGKLHGHQCHPPPRVELVKRSARESRSSAAAVRRCSHRG